MPAVIAAAVLFGPSVSRAQECAHGPLATPEARARRDDALAAARLIDAAQATRPLMAGYAPWQRLGSSEYVASLRGEGGSTGELARRMNWGAEEVLPGWRIHMIATPRAYAFSLRDLRDPCGFAFWSDESGKVMGGYPVDPDRSSVRPLR
jgi:hypothetical protein